MKTSQTVNIIINYVLPWSTLGFLRKCLQCDGWSLYGGPPLPSLYQPAQFSVMTDKELLSDVVNISYMRGC